MTKECLDSLYSSIEESSNNISKALLTLDKEVLEAFKEASKDSKLDFFQWFSKHYKVSLQDIPSITKNINKDV